MREKNIPISVRLSKLGIELAIFHRSTMQGRCLQRRGLLTARRPRRILTEATRTDRLPGGLKRTVIRREGTLLCGNQRRLCHSPFSPPYESRKICSARGMSRGQQCRLWGVRYTVDFPDRGSAIEIVTNARNWIDRSEETAQWC